MKEILRKVQLLIFAYLVSTSGYSVEVSSTSLETTDIDKIAKDILQFAINDHHEAFYQLLIDREIQLGKNFFKNGLYITEQNGLRRTLLSKLIEIACHDHKIKEYINLLLYHGVKANDEPLESVSKYSPILLAVRLGDINIFTELMKENPPVEFEVLGRPFWQIIMETGQLNMLKLVLPNVKNINLDINGKAYNCLNFLRGDLPEEERNLIDFAAKQGNLPLLATERLYKSIIKGSGIAFDMANYIEGILLFRKLKLNLENFLEVSCYPYFAKLTSLCQFESL